MDTLTNLEDRLYQDYLGQVKDQLLNQLDAATCQLAHALRHPLPPEEYARLERQRQSCLAANTVIETLWLRSQHSAPLRR